MRPVRRRWLSKARLVQVSPSGRGRVSPFQVGESDPVPFLMPRSQGVLEFDIGFLLWRPVLTGAKTESPTEGP